MQTHTPGPWTLTPAEFLHAEMERSILSKGRRLFFLSSRADQPTEGEANARLIAAAPELLQACKDALEIFQTARRYFPKSIKNSDRFQLLNIEANSVMKAIRKAEGTDETDEPPTGFAIPGAEVEAAHRYATGQEAQP